MAEVIKTAAIADVELFEMLERNVDAIFHDKELTILTEVVLRCAKIKSDVSLSSSIWISLVLQRY